MGVKKQFFTQHQFLWNSTFLTAAGSLGFLLKYKIDQCKSRIYKSLRFEYEDAAEAALGKFIILGLCSLFFLFATAAAE